MHAPFTPAEGAAHCRQLRNRKAVAGSLPPWFLKAATAQLAPALAALFNAWVQMGQLSAADALSLITAIPKPGAAPDSCDGLRDIAVGTLPAKLFACIMERRISDWAEASGSKAAGQFGFRRQLPYRAGSTSAAHLAGPAPQPGPAAVCSVAGLQQSR